MVAKPKKYDPLEQYLAAQIAPAFRMKFDEVADLVDGLPSSAYHHKAWWANERNPGAQHPQCRAWVSLGYSAIPDINRRIVTFTQF